jgi:hypothetical protein
MLLALAKTQRAFVLVEDIRRKLPTLGDASVVVGQHFCSTFSPSFSLLLNETLLNVKNVLRVAGFYNPKKSCFTNLLITVPFINCSLSSPHTLTAHERV